MKNKYRCEKRVKHLCKNMTVDLTDSSISDFIGLVRSARTLEIAPPCCVISKNYFRTRSESVHIYFGDKPASFFFFIKAIPFPLFCR